MPAYLVEVTKTVLIGKRVVRATTATQALRYVWRTSTEVGALNPDELMAALDEGLKLEDARIVPEDVVGRLPQTDEHYIHKTKCPADGSTPIGKGNCCCPELDL